ncbi:MAG: hypothetical protein FIO02_03090 [Nitrosopumilales archaeon]|nr:hypothetical protein [Nitrosopumilales archaeon]
MSVRKYYYHAFRYHFMAGRSHEQVAKILAAKTITNKEKQDLELDRKITLVIVGFTTVS